MTILNGEDVEALPLSVPPPTFCTVNVRSAELPKYTLPKFCEGGVTLIVGGCGCDEPNVHNKAVLLLTIGLLKLNWLPTFAST